MLNVGGWELLIILLVALIFLGPTRLPEVARQFGQAIGTVKSMASGFQAELEAASKPLTEAVEAGEAESMSLYGPMARQEAVERTQREKEELLAAAQSTTYDEEDPPKAWGGPTNIYARDSVDDDADAGDEEE